MDAEDPEAARQLDEALRRSRAETTREESMLADALAASLTTHDEELALAMQREQVLLLEASLAIRQHQEDGAVQTGADAQCTARDADAGEAYTDFSRGDGYVRTADTHADDAGFVVVSRASSARRNASHRAEVVPATGAASSALSHAGPCPAEGRLKSAGAAVHAGEPAEASCTLPPTQGSCAPAAVGKKPNKGSSRRPRPSTPSPARLGEGASESHQLSSPLAPPVRPLVVIDGQNVGCGLGGGPGSFRARGVQLALDFYKCRGITAVAMLPRSKVDDRASRRGGRLADDPALLRRLAEEGRLSFTPAGVHDDYFLLSYAMGKGADIVSNDRFGKEIELQERGEDVNALVAFLKEHLIPYTFVAGDFIPNPNPTQLGRAVHHSRSHGR